MEGVRSILLTYNAYRIYLPKIGERELLGRANQYEQ
jgi:hypothetical protein